MPATGHDNRSGPPFLFRCQGSLIGAILLFVSSENGSVNPITGRRIVDASVYSVEFKPRGNGRRIVGLLTLVGLVATIYLAGTPTRRSPPWRSGSQPRSAS